MSACVRCLQGVSAGVRVIEAEELSRRLGERDRAIKCRARHPWIQS